MAVVGQTTIDFGTAAARTVDASVVVTGQAAILSNSKVEAYLMGDTSADNSADEHIIGNSMLRLTCGSIVAGTGFTIFAIADFDLVGQFTVQWVWA